MMKSFKFVLAAGVAATILAAAPAYAQFTERSIRISNGVNEDHPNGKGVEKFKACLTDKSGGKLKVQGFWGNALGGDLQATQALRSGTQEMVVTSSSPLIGILPDLGVFDLPFLFANEKEADAVLDGELRQVYRRQAARRSDWSTWPIGRTASATSPIRAARSKSGRISRASRFV